MPSRPINGRLPVESAHTDRGGSRGGEPSDRALSPTGDAHPALAAKLSLAQQQTANAEIHRFHWDHGEGDYAQPIH